MRFEDSGADFLLAYRGIKSLALSLVILNYTFKVYIIEYAFHP